MHRYVWYVVFVLQPQVWSTIIYNVNVGYVAAILIFRSALKHKLGRGRWDLDSSQVSWDSIQRFQNEVENVSANQRSGQSSWFSDSPPPPKKNTHKLGRGRWGIASCQVVQRFQWSKNVSSNQKPGRPSWFFPHRPEITNLVEDVEILRLVKFRWISFSGFRREVENVWANQRPRRPSCLSDRPEKHKLCRGRIDQSSCQVSLNSV